MKDRRYKTVHKNFLSGSIESIAEVLEVLPITVLARDLGMHHYTLGKLFDNPAKFTFETVIKMGALFEVDPVVIKEVVWRDAIIKKPGKTKK